MCVVENDKWGKQVCSMNLNISNGKPEAEQYVWGVVACNDVAVKSTYRRKGRDFLVDYAFCKVFNDRQEQ